MHSDGIDRTERATPRAGVLGARLSPLAGFFSVEVAERGVLVRWRGHVPDELSRVVIECGFSPDLVTVVPAENSRTAYLAEKEVVGQVLDDLPWVCIGPCVDGRTIEIELLEEGVAEARRRLAQRRSTFDYAVSRSEDGYPRTL